MNSVQEYLKNNNILVFDGAMGTYWVQKNRNSEFSCELANLYNPESVLNIHKEYLQAGAKAIKTNTFGLNSVNLNGEHSLLKQAVTAGWDIAKKAQKYKDCFIFADIGRITQIGENSVWDCYQEIIDIFIELGAVNFLFETNYSESCLHKACKYIKSINPESFIMVSFAVQPEGYTREGFSLRNILTFAGDTNIDSVGINCVSSAYHMCNLIKSVDISGINKYFSAMPNSGYPIVVNNRTFYDGDAGYYALQLSELVSYGVKIIGGCCGTTPEHIAQTINILNKNSDKQQAVKRISLNEKNISSRSNINRLWNKLENNNKIFAVELDPPKNAEISKFMAGAWTLKGAGADAITIADCPVGRARMDSSLLACKLRREIDIDALPHLTCRDRNLNATKALLLGLSVEGVNNVLVVTGDPIPTAEKDEVKSVFNFNSRKLAHFINDLNKNELDKQFKVFAALNVNARNFKVELNRAKQKVENGVIGFLTQPVLTQQAVDNIKLARQTLNAKILGGIIPIVSYRNACFMQSEISGINVSDEIIQLYEDKSRSECEELAIKISVEMAKSIYNFVDGFYLVTPFLRVSLITSIIDEIRKLQ